MRAWLAQRLNGGLLKLFSGPAFIFACRMTGAGVTFLTQVLLARWMGASELGVYVLAFSWLTILSTLAVAGLNGSAMRFVGQPLADGNFGAIRGFLRRARQVSVGLSLLVMVGMTGLVLGGQIGEPADRTVYLLAVVALPLYALIVLYAGFANAFAWFGASFTPNNVYRPVAFVLIVAALWLLGQQLDATIVMAVHAVVIAIIGLAVLAWCERAMNRRLPETEPSYDTRLWIRTSIPIMFLILFNTYFPAYTVIVAGSLITSADIAIYNSAFRVALLISFGVMAIDAFFAPQLMRLYAVGDQDGLRRLASRTTRMRFLIALVGVAGFAVLGEWILGFFGEEFVRGYWVLLILGLTQLVQAAAGPAARLLSMTGHQDQGLYISVASLALSAALIWALTVGWGVTGTAVAALVAITLWSGAMRYVVAKELGLRRSLLLGG